MAAGVPRSKVRYVASLMISWVEWSAAVLSGVCVVPPADHRPLGAGDNPSRFSVFRSVDL